MLSLFYFSLLTAGYALKMSVPLATAPSAATMDVARLNVGNNSTSTGALNSVTEIASSATAGSVASSQMNNKGASAAKADATAGAQVEPPKGKLEPPKGKPPKRVVVRVKIIEIVTLFIYVESLGGPPPAVISSGNPEAPFVVLKVVFKDLRSAAERACAIQLERCNKGARAVGAGWSAARCRDQNSRCMKVASTAKPVEGGPATLTATATVTESTEAPVIESNEAPVTGSPAAAISASANEDAIVELGPGGKEAKCIPTTITKTITMTGAAKEGDATASAGWKGRGKIQKMGEMGKTMKSMTM